MNTHLNSNILKIRLSSERCCGFFFVDLHLHLGFKIKILSHRKRPVLPAAAAGRKLVISEQASPKQHRSNTGNKPLRGNSLPLSKGKRLLKKPLACNSAYCPMDMVTSKAGNVGAQAVPDQVDILELEERVLLQGKKDKIICPSDFWSIWRCSYLQDSSLIQRRDWREGADKHASFFISSRHLQVEWFGWRLWLAPDHSSQFPPPVMIFFV